MLNEKHILLLKVFVPPEEEFILDAEIEDKQPVEKGRDILEERPILWVDTRIEEKELDELKRIYQGFERFLVIRLSNHNS